MNDIINTLLRLLYLPLCLLAGSSGGLAVDPGWGGCNAITGN